jgi:putative SOS response-associated peptidase YedK
VAVITELESRRAEWMRWGLIPGWAKDPSIGSRMINARSETLLEKPSFRGPLARRRCLILADGFYEWRKGGKFTVPFYFSLRSGEAFAFAGLWDDWEPKGVNSEPGLPGLTTCTIITTNANPLVAEVHPRMPVMLTGQAMWDWLTEPDANKRLSLLQPFDPSLMRSWEVSRAVNSPAQDDPSLIQPASGGLFDG